MQKNHIVASKLESSIISEKEQLVGCDHPFIIKMYRTYQDENSLMMLLELVPGGELYTHLQSLPGRRVSTEHARFVALCVLSVFDYIHQKVREILVVFLFLVFFF